MIFESLLKMLRAIEIVTMGYWETNGVKRWGHLEPTLINAAREQLIPDTCWACSLAIASAILDVKVENNEIRWFQRAKKRGLTEVNGRISVQNFLKLSNDWNQRHSSLFKICLYNNLEIAPKLASLLANGNVVLLFSAEHVIVLGALIQQGDTAILRIIDPASKGVQSWTIDDFNKFVSQSDCIAVVGNQIQN
jgi:hypothetical protein